MNPRNPIYDARSHCYIRLCERINLVLNEILFSPRNDFELTLIANHTIRSPRFCMEIVFDKITFAILDWKPFIEVWITN